MLITVSFHPVIYNILLCIEKLGSKMKAQKQGPEITGASGQLVCCALLSRAKPSMEHGNQTRNLHSNEYIMSFVFI